MKVHPPAVDEEQLALAAAKIRGLVGVLTASAAGWDGWAPTPELLAAYADLAAAAGRHLSAA